MRNTLCGFLSLVVALVAHGEALPTPIPINYDVENIWIPLPSVAIDTDDSVGTTYNTIPFSQALHHETGKLLGKSMPEFDCDPADLRRSFRLEKGEFLLGEPILVEYRIELHGEGSWTEGRGGNYRSRGRDDNFYFLLRRNDGTWVDEVHPNLGGFGGGLGGGNRVDKENPSSDWQAVQRWAAITEPGDYELFCFYRPMGWHTPGALTEAAKALLPREILETHRVEGHGRLIDNATNEVSKHYYIEDQSIGSDRNDSALLAHMPDAIHALLAEEVPAMGASLQGDDISKRHVLSERQRAIGTAQVYARFPIQITAGTPAERKAMVEQWRDLTGPDKLPTIWQSRERAALGAIHFSLSEDFLPLIEQWAHADPQCIKRNALSHGLSLMESPRATSLLLDADERLKHRLHNSYKFGSPLPVAQHRILIKNLITLLDDEAPEKRNRALELVRQVAGGWYLGDAQAPLTDLSREQMKTAQVRWEAWFEAQPEPMPSFVNGVWGYIDTTGGLAIPPQFTYAGEFRGGVAQVSRGAAPVHIDTRGNLASQPPPRVGEGPFPVVKDGKWGYEDAHGTIVIPPQFEQANDFQSGRATVRLEDLKTVVIDNTGQIIFGAERNIQAVYPDGSMTFRKSGPTGRRYGLLDRGGHEILPAVYEIISPSNEGLIMVAESTESGGMRYGFANAKGELVIAPIYSGASWFSGGLAAVNSGDAPKDRWGYIDKNGAMAITPRFKHVSPFFEGLAYAGVQDDAHQPIRYGYIDTTGKWVIPPQFQRAGNFSNGRATVQFSSPHRWLGGPDSLAGP